MTHKKFDRKTEEEIYVPLHVGKDGKEDIGYIGDNTGEHISEKNPEFCELTGLYWIWKNSDAQILGLCHYRRYFECGGHILGRKDIEERLSLYDIIIANSAMAEKSVWDHYCKKHHKDDLICCREVVREKYPDYLDAFDLTIHANLTSIGNMMICRKEILDSYCEWLFDILFEVERRCDTSNYDSYQKRLYGFLSERLLRVWLMQQKFMVWEENVVMIE